MTRKGFLYQVSALVCCAAMELRMLPQPVRQISDIGITAEQLESLRRARCKQAEADFEHLGICGIMKPSPYLKLIDRGEDK